jgi:hypothetical protein
MLGKAEFATSGRVEYLSWKFEECMSSRPPFDSHAGEIIQGGFDTSAGIAFD